MRKKSARDIFTLYMYLNILLMDKELIINAVVAGDVRKCDRHVAGRFYHHLSGCDRSTVQLSPLQFLGILGCTYLTQTYSR